MFLGHLIYEELKNLIGEDATRKIANRFNKGSLYFPAPRETSPPVTSMMVSIKDDTGAIIWEHGIKNGIPCGMSNKSFIHNGVQQNIIDLLAKAERQARAELTISLNEGDGMLNSGTSAT